MGTRATGKTRASYGQATVEFAVVSVVFLMIVLGTIDFGRSIYLYSQLNNAVRDAAREGKVSLSSGFGVDSAALARRVRIDKNRETSAETPRPGLDSAAASVSCSGGCSAGGQADSFGHARLPGGDAGIPRNLPHHAESVLDRGAGVTGHETTFSAPA